MKSYNEWCRHYSLPDNDKSRREYDEYRENYEVLMVLVSQQHPGRG